MATVEVSRGGEGGLGLNSPLRPLLRTNHRKWCRAILCLRWCGDLLSRC